MARCSTHGTELVGFDACGRRHDHGEHGWHDGHDGTMERPGQVRRVKTATYPGFRTRLASAYIMGSWVTTVGPCAEKGRWVGRPVGEKIKDLWKWATEEKEVHGGFRKL
jgi:hypothetical protein